MTVLGKYTTSEDRKRSALRERDPRLWEEFGFIHSPTASGVNVTPDTALQLAAYYDAIRIISEDIAKLPFLTYRRLEPRGKERAPNHPVWRLLKEQSNRNMTAMKFRETITSHALGWGNGYAFIRRDLGVPIELDLIHPSRVDIGFTDSGDAFYMVKMPNGSVATIPQFNMFHISGLTHDGVEGISVARVGAESIGRGVSQQAFGASFFRSGSSPMGALKHPFELEEEVKERMRAQWQETYGGPNGWHKPLFLEEGMEWQSISIPPEDAQLLEAEGFTVLEIARWFRLQPHKLASLADATFSNVEEMNIDHVTDTLMPWTERWEEEALRKLFAEDRDTFFAEHLFNALMRGNAEARSTFYREMWHIGSMSQNDIRDAENMNPIDDGDTYYVPLNVTRTEDAAEGETGGGETDAVPPGRDDGNDNQPRDFEAIEERARAFRARAAISFRTVLLEAVAKLQTRERKRIEYLVKKNHVGDALAERVSEFYQKHGSIIVSDLRPLVGAAHELALEADPVELDLGAIVSCYVRDVCAAGDAAGYFVAIEKEGPLMVRVIVESIFGKERDGSAGSEAAAAAAEGQA